MGAEKEQDLLNAEQAFKEESIVLAHQERRIEQCASSHADVCRRLSHSEKQLAEQRKCLVSSEDRGSHVEAECAELKYVLDEHRKEHVAEASRMLEEVQLVEQRFNEECSHFMAAKERLRMQGLEIGDLRRRATMQEDADVLQSKLAQREEALGVLEWSVTDMQNRVVEKERKLAEELLALDNRKLALIEQEKTCFSSHDHRIFEDSFMQEEARHRLADLERQLDEKSGQLAAQEEEFAAEKLKLSARRHIPLARLEAETANGLLRPRLTSQRRVGGGAKLLCNAGDAMHRGTRELADAQCDAFASDQKRHKLIGGEISPVVPCVGFHDTCTTNENKLGVESQQLVTDDMSSGREVQQQSLVSTFSRLARPLASAFMLPFCGHGMQPGRE